MKQIFLLLLLVLSVAFHSSLASNVKFNKEIVQAAEDDDIETVKRLVLEGQSPDSQSKGITLLHLAIKNENLELIDFLLEQGADPNIPNPVGENPSVLAITTGNDEVVSRVLGSEKVDITHLTPFKFSIMHVAAQWGSVKAANILQERGFSAWNGQNDYLDTPLHLALKKHSRNVAWFLLKKDEVDVHLKNDGDWNPFLLAVVDGDPEIVKYLHEVRGADDKSKTTSGETALHRAIQHLNNEVAEYLVSELGHSVEGSDDHGWTPLHYAVLLGNLEGFDFLIAQGADPLRDAGDLLFLPEINEKSKNTKEPVKELFRQKLAAYFPPEKKEDHEGTEKKDHPREEL